MRESDAMLFPSMHDSAPWAVAEASSFGLPVWSASFLPDNRTLLTGGADRIIRRWDASNGEQIGSLAVGGAEDTLAPYAGDRGAGARGDEAFRGARRALGDRDRAGPRA